MLIRPHDEPAHVVELAEQTSLPVAESSSSQGTPAQSACALHEAVPARPLKQADSQLSPKYPVTQSQPQFPVVPVALPPFWQAFPSAPTVHASAVAQRVPEYPAMHVQVQLPVVPDADPPFSQSICSVAAAALVAPDAVPSREHASAVSQRVPEYPVAHVHTNALTPLKHDVAFAPHGFVPHSSMSAQSTELS